MGEEARKAEEEGAADEATMPAAEGVAEPLILRPTRKIRASNRRTCSAPWARSSWRGGCRAGCGWRAAGPAGAAATRDGVFRRRLRGR